MNLFRKIWSKKQGKIGLILFGILLVGGFLFKPTEKVPEFSRAEVQKINLIQSVRETGQVVSGLELTYGWENSGRVIEKQKKVGDIVKKGEAIALLDSGEAAARLQQGYAVLQGAQARLLQQTGGHSAADITKSQSSVDQAMAALAQAKAQAEKTKSLSQKSIDTAQKVLDSAFNDLRKTDGGENSEIVNNAYENLTNAMQTTLATLSNVQHNSDEILGIDNTLANAEYKDVLGVLDIGTLINAKNAYVSAKALLATSNTQASMLSTASSHTQIDAAVRATDTAITSVKTLVFYMNALIEATRPIGGLTQPLYDTIKTVVSSDRSAVNSVAASFSTSKQSISTARAALTSYSIAYAKAQGDLSTAQQQALSDTMIAEAQVASAQAAANAAQAGHTAFINPPRAVDIASLQADVASASANVQVLKDQADKMKLTALADGVISLLSVEVGETVSPNQSVLTLLSDGLTVSVDISESDIAKVRVTQKAVITLDAFGDAVMFTGKVVAVDPAQTEISGVIYYKTKIILDQLSEYDVRSGMTANVQIITNSKDDVLVIPERAVLTEGGKQTVRVLTDSKKVIFSTVPVKTGLRGDNGMVEILSGLSQGQEIITFLKST